MNEDHIRLESVNFYDSSTGTFKFGDISVRNGVIESISEKNIEERSEIFVIPGLVNTHTHIAMSRFRGLLDDMDLEHFLIKTFDLDRDRTDDDIYHSSIIGMYELIMNGVTSFMDLYYSENIIAMAASDMGIRAFLSWVTLDPDKTTQKGNPLDNAENFIKEFSGKKGGYVNPSIGIQGVYVASMDNISLAGDISRRYNTVLHMHLAETRKEVYDYMDEHGKRPALDLLDHNLIDNRTNMAHCVWLTKEEIEKIGKARGNVSWNSVSNHKLGVGGVPAIPELMESGANIGLGTDSNGSNNSLNLLETAKHGSLAIKNSRWDASVLTSRQIFHMLTESGGKSTGMKDLGKIKVGAPADLLVIDGNNYSLNMARSSDFINDLVYSMSPSAIRDVIINGKFVKKDFKIQDEIEKKYRESVKWIRERF